MINTDMLLEYINNHYTDIKGISNKIVAFANDLGMSYAGVYKIIRTKKLSLENLLLMKQILNFSLDEITIPKQQK